MSNKLTKKPSIISPKPLSAPSSIPSEQLANQADTWRGPGQPAYSPTPPPSNRPQPQRQYSNGSGARGGDYQQQQYWANSNQMPSYRGDYAEPQSYAPAGGRYPGRTPPPIFAPPYPPGNHQPPQHQLQHAQSYSTFPSSQGQFASNPPQQNPNYRPASAQGAHPSSQFISNNAPQQPYHLRPGQPRAHPRAVSMTDPQLPSLESLAITSNPANPHRTNRKTFYASEEDGPPWKLSVVLPDQNMLAQIRDTLTPSDVAKKVAWAKQVLKFIERHQSASGNVSRINDPVLVRWTDEALNHILNSASSPTPVPLALYLRGDLVSSGSFPSYKQKDAKAAFRDFEAAANAGYVKAWFRIGRAYEEFGDTRRAMGAYEKGADKGDCGSTYRIAMAYLLGQLGVTSDIPKAIGLLKSAAELADLDTPQPPYVLGMILSGEFESPTVQIPKDVVPVNIEEAKLVIERSAYLSFGPAQYKMGFSYEYAALGCPFDPFLSVQYYALASQSGEVEADMALSKWYLCGSKGQFEKNEALAVRFAEKAAARQLPSAEFALGYYREVGIDGNKDIAQAKMWYLKAASHGNTDARDRLEAVSKSESNVLSRDDHESRIDTTLVRKRTQAQARSELQHQQSPTSRTSFSSVAYSQSQGVRGRSESPNAGPGAFWQAPGAGPPRPNSDGQGSRRRDALTQVEAAALIQWTPNDAHPPRSRDPSSQTASLTSSLRSYQLSDGPPTHSNSQSPRGNSASSGSSGQRLPQRNQSSTPSTPPSTAEIPMQKRPETFAEMGITTQKAKKEECTVM